MEPQDRQSLAPGSLTAEKLPAHWASPSWTVKGVSITADGFDPRIFRTGYYNTQSLSLLSQENNSAFLTIKTTKIFRLGKGS